MNNDYVKKYKYRSLGKTALIALVTFSCWILLFYIFGTIFNGFVANILIGFNQEWANFMMAYKIPIMLIIMLITVIIAWFISINQATKKLILIINSIDMVFNKDEALITLPYGLKDIETKLNTIKYENIKNEQAAQAAEQRKNDLVVYLAHDLKTPLTSILGYLNLLNEEKNVSENLKDKYINIALEKAQRLEDLINEFFEIARFNLQNISLEKNNIDLTVMLTQLQDEFYPLYMAKNLECTINVDAGLLIKADGDKLARVFTNLLRNAIAYSYENTEINITGQKLGEQIKITFRNQGPEISEHKLNSIFEKFYRIDTARSSQTGGAGLGLAIAKELVELHHGQITAQSNADFTEFTILLPSFTYDAVKFNNGDTIEIINR